MTSPFRSLARTAALVAVVAALAAPAAEARPAGGSSVGSRGSRTWSAPPSTATSPGTAQPMQRTETPNLGTQRPGMAPGQAAPQPRRFGFGTGLMAGLLGAGLFGMLFGHGFMGGLAGLTSMLGLLLQIGLIVGLVWLAIRFFRRRQEPALAGAGAAPAYGRSALGASLGGGAARGPAAPPQGPVTIAPADYEAFEKLLGDIQTAYGSENLQRLTDLATPEMIRYFGTDLEANRSRGLRNEVSSPKLLQGDLSEAWREGNTEYATVAMRFSLVDVMVDRTTGRVVEGDRNRPSEATEMWTFRREAGQPWMLSAIQQTA
jgi:predicted lipid-binding transport protein (Tim44 family)